MTALLSDHWPHFIGTVTALTGALAGLWRLRLGGWVRRRIAVEMDLVYCKREVEILEGYIEKMEKRLGSD